MQSIMEMEVFAYRMKYIAFSINIAFAKIFHFSMLLYIHVIKSQLEAVFIEGGLHAA